MTYLLAIIAYMYTFSCYAVGPSFELKAQAPMKVMQVEAGEYEIPDYAVTSWSLYLPIPVLTVKDYTVVADLTFQGGKMHFQSPFSLGSEFEDRGYTAVGLGLFPLKEEGVIQPFGFYRRFSGLHSLVSSG